MLPKRTNQRFRFAMPWMLGILAALSLSSAMGDIVAKSAGGVERAMKIGLSDVVADNGNWQRLEIVDEQAVELQQRYRDYRQVLHAHSREALGIEVDEHVTGDILELGKRQGQEFRDERKRIQDAFDDQLLEILLPHQIETAYGLVLQRRFETGGYRALLASEDNPIFAGACFRTSVIQMRDRISRAEQKISEEEERLREELAAALLKYRTGVARVTEQELGRAIEDLGKDGEILQELAGEK